MQQLRDQSRALIAACEKTVNGVTDAAVQQLAVKDLKIVRERLSQAAGQINVDPVNANLAVKNAQTYLNKALANAETAAKQWSKRQVRARAELATIHQNLQAEKQVANQSGQQALFGLDEKIAQAKSLYRQGKYKELQKTCEKAQATIKKAEQAALDETVRREVVRGLLSTLTNMGFVTDSPQLHGDDPAVGVVKLTGRTPSGRTAKFEINLDGQMGFDFDGYEGRTCAKDMDKISDILQKEMDVTLGAPQITWKNPDKISKGAVDAPAGNRLGNIN